MDCTLFLDKKSKMADVQPNCHIEIKDWRDLSSETRKKYNLTLLIQNNVLSALQAKATELTGKDAALFVTSGTMGNLVSGIVKHVLI